MESNDTIPTTITLAGITLRFSAARKSWVGENGSFAWRYADDDVEPAARGRFGAAMRIGDVEAGGVESTLEELDRVVSEKIRRSILPMVDLVLHRANSARLNLRHREADELMAELRVLVERIPLAPPGADVGSL